MYFCINRGNKHRLENVMEWMMAVEQQTIYDLKFRNVDASVSLVFYLSICIFVEQAIQ